MGIFKTLFGSKFNYPKDVQDIEINKTEDLVDWIIEPVTTKGGTPKNNPVMQSKVKVSIGDVTYTVKSASIKEGELIFKAE